MDKYDGQIYSELEPFHFEVKAKAFFFFSDTLSAAVRVVVGAGSLHVLF